MDAGIRGAACAANTQRAALAANTPTLCFSMKAELFSRSFIDCIFDRLACDKKTVRQPQLHARRVAGGAPCYPPLFQEWSS